MPVEMNEIDLDGNLLLIAKTSPVEDHMPDMEDYDHKEDIDYGIISDEYELAKEEGVEKAPPGEDPMPEGGMEMDSLKIEKAAPDAEV